MSQRKKVAEKVAEREYYNPEAVELPIDLLRANVVGQIEQHIKDLTRLRGVINNYNPTPNSPNLPHLRQMLIGWGSRSSEVAARTNCAIGLLLTRLGQE